MLKKQDVYGNIIDMMSLFYVLIGAVGAIFGSFLACQAWRLRFRDLKKQSLGKRSVCLSCHKQLKWYDNLPIISWVLLRGKCRYCGKKIGVMEILAEVLMAIAFVGISIVMVPSFELDWSAYLLYGLTLVLVLLLGFLAIYDGKWGELPNFMLIIAGGVAAVMAILRFVLPELGGDVVGLLGAVGILGGIYLMLYFISKGQWVGDGDWILGAVIAIALGDAWLALITLFLANFLGLVIMYPAVRKNNKRKIYFGPFLVAGYVIALIFADFCLGLINL